VAGVGWVRGASRWVGSAAVQQSALNTQHSAHSSQPKPHLLPLRRCLATHACSDCQLEERADAVAAHHPLRVLRRKQGKLPSTLAS
jgi:hypothetical protein